MYPPGYTTGDEDDEALDGRWDAVPNTQTNKHMGDMADWMLDEAMMSLEDDGWDDETPIKPRVPDGYWKMKDGKLVKITKMTDSHLANSIALCQRKGMYRLAQPLVEEQNRRAEFMDMVMAKRDPLYAAFTAGWNAGHKSASDEAYPEVGFSMPETKKGAWESYKKSIEVDSIKRVP